MICPDWLLIFNIWSSLLYTSNSTAVQFLDSFLKVLLPDRVEFLHHYPLDVRKWVEMFSFQCHFDFWKKKIVHRGMVRWIRWMVETRHLFLCQKTRHLFLCQKCLYFNSVARCIHATRSSHANERLPARTVAFSAASVLKCLCTLYHWQFVLLKLILYA